MCSGRELGGSVQRANVSLVLPGAGKVIGSIYLFRTPYPHSPIPLGARGGSKTDHRTTFWVMQNMQYCDKTIARITWLPLVFNHDKLRCRAFVQFYLSQR